MAYLQITAVHLPAIYSRLTIQWDLGREWRADQKTDQFNHYCVLDGFDV
jgi:hypothetical protein